MTLAVGPLTYANRSDLARCATLIRESITVLASREHFNQEHGIDGWTKNAVYDLVMSDYACVACDAGGLRGVAALCLAEECRLLVLYTHPGYAKRGIASLLFRRMEEAAKVHGYERISAFSSFLARGFYLKHGFVSDGAPEKGAGMTWNYPMVKVLGKNV